MGFLARRDQSSLAQVDAGSAELQQTLSFCGKTSTTGGANASAMSKPTVMSREPSAATRDSFDDLCARRYAEE
jgi:hypothetical protein